MKLRIVWVALAISAVCWGAIEAEGAPKKLSKKTTTIDCSELVENLRFMRQAQSALMNTLVKKNDSMAETLDLYAQRLKQRGGVDQTEIGGLQKSAQSFRKHGARERGIVRRFEASSAKLMARLEACLARPKIAQRR